MRAMTWIGACLLTALVACLLTALVAGCGDDGAEPSMDAGRPVDGGRPPDGARMPPMDAGPAGPRDTGHCPMLWVVEDPGTSVNASARIEVGGLELEAESIPAGDTALTVSQGGLSGDFAAELDFERFFEGFQGAYARAFVRNSDGVTAVSGIFTFPMPAVSAAILDGDTPPMDVAETTEIEGTMRFSRVGDELTITTAAGGAMATVSGTFAGEAEIGVQLGNNGAIQVDPITRVRFTEFRLTDGGDFVQPDTFDCDSLVE